jgi:hypothetical protein
VVITEGGQFVFHDDLLTDFAAFGDCRLAALGSLLEQVGVNVQAGLRPA